jgi:uncharacterized membrane protein
MPNVLARCTLPAADQLKYTVAVLSAARPHALLSYLLLAACSRTSTTPQQPAAATAANAQATAVTKPASAEEVSYRATGTEPFWGLAVTQHELRVTWPEPTPSVATTYAVEERADGRTYKGAVLTATVTFKTCSDGMSDRTYPHTVKVEIADRVLQGCGWPAGYDLGPPP